MLFINYKIYTLRNLFIYGTLITLKSAPNPSLPRKSFPAVNKVSFTIYF